jgi:amino-acid N-acetyltransferase
MNPEAATLSPEPVAQDDPDLIGSLAAAGLPVVDLAGPGKRFYGFRDDAGRLIAAGGIEVMDTAAVLRSCVVDHGRRAKGMGTALVKAVLREAAEAGVTDVYLLTETAETYFSRLGFAVVDRADVPETVARSSQFAGVCPDSATAMAMKLDPGG